MLEKARSAYIELVLKLNEATFKPAFLRTVDWAFVAPEDDQSELTVYLTIGFAYVWISGPPTLALKDFLWLNDPAC